MVCMSPLGGVGAIPSHSITVCATMGTMYVMILLLDRTFAPEIFLLQVYSFCARLCTIHLVHVLLRAL